MILQVADLQTLHLCFAAAALFEFFRILLGFYFARPPDKIRLLEEEKVEAQLELSTIKSVQLELVKHSKLSRKVIKIDKQIETLQLEQIPRAKKAKLIFRILRLVAYVAVSAAYYQTSLFVISSVVFWPLTIFTSSPTVTVYPWMFVFLAGSAVRQLLRACFEVAIPGVVLP